jgi:hypothetical protein
MPSDFLASLRKVFFPTPEPAHPARMSDPQLLRAVVNVGAGLLDGLAPIHQASFHPRPVDDPRWHHGMPTTVAMHIRGLYTTGNDSFCLAVLGLKANASAAALGPIRHLYETLAVARWLTEPGAAEQRERAFALTRDSIAWLEKNYVSALGALGDDPELEPLQQRMRSRRTAAMSEDLAAIAREDGLRNDVRLPNRRDLFTTYLDDAGGYLSFALLSTAGSHPGALQSTLFYGVPGVGVDYDFKGLHALRAYWLSGAGVVHLELCRLCGPICGWTNQETLLTSAESSLTPLAQEAQKRFLSGKLAQLSDSVGAHASERRAGGEG